MTPTLPLLALAFTITYGWHAPTENADGTPLQDLAWFNFYVRPDTNFVPGQDIVAVLTNGVDPAPAAGEEYTNRVVYAIDTHHAWASVTAFDFAGNESGFCPPRLFTNVAPSPPPLQILDASVGAVASTNPPLAAPPMPLTGDAP